ncbi:hypothetical protein AWB77_02913 [Caballeronia fortuita]|uniref:Uncharacterized protein n=1 Tax=Caballeronia fortuita TaxID=1777138 RepID=A0A158BL62_9BURK|nr:hypothetical protein [Caballeronia fortuita]SAK70057.1 hypothetical protein AWB77_02913 [Caballeronia fortuita]
MRGDRVVMRHARISVLRLRTASIVIFHLRTARFAMLHLRTASIPMFHLVMPRIMMPAFIMMFGFVGGCSGGESQADDCEGSEFDFHENCFLPE